MDDRRVEAVARALIEAGAFEEYAEPRLTHFATIAAEAAIAALTPKGGDGLERLARAAYDEGFNDGADVEQGIAAAPRWEETRACRDVQALSATSVQPEVSEAGADIIQRRIGPAISREDAVSIARECLGANP